MSIQFTLVCLALALCLVSGITGKVPLWISVLLLCIALLIR